MEYEEAKKIFTKYGFNFYDINDENIYKKYMSYRVPREVELQWIKEELDEFIDRFVTTVNNNNKEFSSYSRALKRYDGYYTKEQVIKIYNAIVSLTNSIKPRVAIELVVLENFYSIIEKYGKKDDLIIQVIDNIMNRIDYLIKNDISLQQRFQDTYNNYENLKKYYSMSL